MRWLSLLAARFKTDSGRQFGEANSVGELNANELVSRFVYSSRAFSRQHNRVHPGAFSPEPHPKLSVLHSSGLEEAEIWQSARQTLGAQRGRDKIYGRADLSVRKLIAQKLKAIRDNDPFERHTSVVGWPQNDDPDQRKADIKAICLELSQDADTNVFILDQPIQNSQ